MNKTTRNDIITCMCVISFIILIIYSIVYMAVKTPSHSTPHTYEVIDKYTEIGSHYNILTDKQVVGTEHIVLFKDINTNEVVAHAVSKEEYYKYTPGTNWTFQYKLY